MNKLAISVKMSKKVTKFGPWGGPGGEYRDVQVAPYRLVRLKIRSGETVDGISFTYIGIDGLVYNMGHWGSQGGVPHEMSLHRPEYLYEVEVFVRELRMMVFTIGFRTSPLYAQIPHDRNEEKCCVKVTITGDCEDFLSVMFEARGRRYSHACLEVARATIGELRDVYNKQLVNTEYRYHPRLPHGEVHTQYVDPEGIQKDVTLRHVIELLWAMDGTRAVVELVAQDREDRNRVKICKQQDKIDHLEKELAELKGEAPPQKPRIRFTQGKEPSLLPVSSWRRRFVWWSQLP